MRAWRPIYTYVKRECSAEPSIGRSCVTETFSISPRFTPMIFYLHTNSVLLRAHLCTAVLLLAHLCTAVLIGSCAKNCVRNCSWWERQGLSTHMYIGIVQQNPLMVEPYGTDEFSISPRFSPMIFDPHANTVFLRAHLCTAVLLLAHLCTAVLIGSMRRTLCLKLFMMRAWRYFYTYVQRECSAEPSIGRILWDWRVFHLSSVQANDFWSPCKSSALTSTPLYSSTPTSTSVYSGINRLYAQNSVFEIVHDGSLKAYLHICTTGVFSKTLWW